MVFGYVSGILNAVPALKQMVIRQTADEIDLNNSITIAVRLPTIGRCVASQSSAPSPTRFVSRTTKA